MRKINKDLSTPEVGKIDLYRQIVQGYQAMKEGRETPIEEVKVKKKQKFSRVKPIDSR